MGNMNKARKGDLESSVELWRKERKNFSQRKYFCSPDFAQVNYCRRREEQQSFEQCLCSVKGGGGVEYCYTVSMAKA
jgi:hypothetical protein